MRILRLVLPLAVWVGSATGKCIQGGCGSKPRALRKGASVEGRESGRKVTPDLEQKTISVSYLFKKIKYS